MKVPDKSQSGKKRSRKDDDSDDDSHDDDDSSAGSDGDERRPKKSRKSGPSTKRPGAAAASNAKSTKSAKSKSSGSKSAPTFGPRSATLKQVDLPARDPFSTDRDFDAEPGEEIRWWRWNEDPSLPAGYKLWEWQHAGGWVITVRPLSLVRNCRLTFV